MTGGEEENQEKSGAVDAWSMEEIAEGDKGDDKERGGICWDEEEREPTEKPTVSVEVLYNSFSFNICLTFLDKT